MHIYHTQHAISKFLGSQQSVSSCFLHVWALDTHFQQILLGNTKEKCACPRKVQIIVLVSLLRCNTTKIFVHSIYIVFEIMRMIWG